jgi:hypothetical protein
MLVLGRLRFSPNRHGGLIIDLPNERVDHTCRAPEVRPAHPFLRFCQGYGSTQRRIFFIAFMSSSVTEG